MFRLANELQSGQNVAALATLLRDSSTKDLLEGMSPAEKTEC